MGRFVSGMTWARLTATLSGIEPRTAFVNSVRVKLYCVTKRHVTCTLTWAKYRIYFSLHRTVIYGLYMNTALCDSRHVTTLLAVYKSSDLFVQCACGQQYIKFQPNEGIDFTFLTFTVQRQIYASPALGQNLYMLPKVYLCIS